MLTLLWKKGGIERIKKEKEKEVKHIHSSQAYACLPFFLCQQWVIMSKLEERKHRGKKKEKETIPSGCMGLLLLCILPLVPLIPRVLHTKKK